MLKKNVRARIVELKAIMNGLPTFDDEKEMSTILKQK